MNDTDTTEAPKAPEFTPTLKPTTARWALVVVYDIGPKRLHQGGDWPEHEMPAPSSLAAVTSGYHLCEWEQGGEETSRPLTVAEQGRWDKYSRDIREHAASTAERTES